MVGTGTLTFPRSERVAVPTAERDCEGGGDRLDQLHDSTDEGFGPRYGSLYERGTYLPMHKYRSIWLTVASM